MEKRERVEQKERMDGKEGLGTGKGKDSQLVLIRGTHVWGEQR